MKENVQLNADRFLGFADVYNNARPTCPEKVKEIILNYLGYKPRLVVDIGCGTGLSTRVWSDTSDKIIGIEPGKDMMKIAKEESSKLKNISFISRFSDNTGLEDGCADVVTCSQSFHWMNPKTTIPEVERILKKGGVFAVYDCDWPPVCNWEAELEYKKLFEKVNNIESSNTKIKDSFIKWSKDNHLSNIKNSNKFRYVREIVFSNSENCSAARFINLALSQGGLQSIIKNEISEINPYLIDFKNNIKNIFCDSEFEVYFCYRMRIAVK
jgi:ubiquinone/menaquinone biosynthesis C-methylase UbiE